MFILYTRSRDVLDEQGECVIITVHSLGKFEIRNENLLLDEDIMRSDMLTKLLMYLLIHRANPITIQELSDALWTDEETDNPAGALKNLMYRLRTILRKNLGEEDYILTSRGVYSWNPEIAVTLDAELFEQFYEAGKKENDDTKKIGNYEKALALYHGDFMSKITDRHWVVTASAYYHSLYLSAIKTLAELYIKGEQYEDAERICSEGLKYDAVDEWLHSYRITALICQNKQKLAQECYEQASKVLYDALGVHKSEQLEQVHQELLKMSKGTEAEALEKVHLDMQEAETPEGAFICGYPVFREIYRLEARKLGRLGSAQYIMLLTVKLREGASAGNEQMEKYIINQAMGQMETALRSSLRIGDVASRYSDSQYVALLPACTYENCVMVAERVRRRFEEKSKSRRVVMEADFEEMTRVASSIVR